MRPCRLSAVVSWDVTGYLPRVRVKEIGWLVLVLVFVVSTGCNIFTDAATRIAYDIEAGAGKLGKEEGARHSIRHKTPSASGQCTGPYKVQFDKVGALIIWCKDDSGKTVSSHSTSYAARFVDTPQTWMVDKPSSSTLTIEIERQGSRAVIVKVQ